MKGKMSSTQNYQTPRATRHTSQLARADTDGRKRKEKPPPTALKFLTAEKRASQCVPASLFGSPATMPALPGVASDLTSKVLGSHRAQKLAAADIDKAKTTVSSFQGKRTSAQPTTGSKSETQNHTAKQPQDVFRQETVTRFQQDLKDQLFRVIFRDKEFMKEVDRKLQEKTDFEEERESFLPTIKKVKGQTTTFESERIQEMKRERQNPSKSGTTQSCKKEKSPFSKPNPNLKFGKVINTKKFEFNAEDFFWKNKVTTDGRGIDSKHSKKLGDGGRQQSDLQQESTLDEKGRINDGMLLLYKETDKLDGLYNKIKTRRSGLPAAREEEEEVAGRVASIFGAYSRTRAPQFSSRSMSPYLLANSFNFDVTEILQEVKAARERQLLEQKYADMTAKELNAALKAETLKVDTDRGLCDLIQAAQHRLRRKKEKEQQKALELLEAPSQVPIDLRSHEGEETKPSVRIGAQSPGGGDSLVNKRKAAQRSSPTRRATDRDADERLQYIIDTFSRAAADALDETSTYRQRSIQLAAAARELDEQIIARQKAAGYLLDQEEDQLQTHDNEVGHTQTGSKLAAGANNKQGKAQPATLDDERGGGSEAQPKGEQKFAAIETTKSVKRRHQGLKTEISHEVARNEKFLTTNVGEAEEALLTDNVKQRMGTVYEDQASKTTGDLRRQQAAHADDITLGAMNELKDFKNSKQSLLKKLVGHSNKKEKVKDMGLGSASSQFQRETDQNVRVLERLLDDAHHQREKMNSLGLPLEVIKEELFKAQGKTKEYVVEAKPRERPTSPLRAFSPAAQQRGMNNMQMSPHSQRGIPPPATRSKPTLAIEVMQVQESDIGPIQQDAGTVSPVHLSPIARKPLLQTMVAHALNSNLNVCDYPELAGRDESADGINYLPRARTKANPNARGGAITIEPHAPSPRLDRAMQFENIYEQQKRLSLRELLVKMGIEEGSSPNKVKTISKVKVEAYLKSVMRGTAIDQFKQKLSKHLASSTAGKARAKAAPSMALPESWMAYVGKDKILQLYFEEGIQRGCKDIVHQRIISDTAKMQTFELGQLLRRFEKVLYQEAHQQGIEVRLLQQQISREMQVEDKLDEVLRTRNQKKDQGLIRLHKGDSELQLAESDDESDQDRSAEPGDDRATPISPSLPTLRAEAGQSSFKTPERKAKVLRSRVDIDVNINTGAQHSSARKQSMDTSSGLLYDAGDTALELLRSPQTESGKKGKAQYSRALIRDNKYVHRQLSNHKQAVQQRRASNTDSYTTPSKVKQGAKPGRPQDAALMAYFIGLENDWEGNITKALNFDVDGYQKQILTQKSDKLTQDQARVEAFMANAAERRDERLLPFERSGKWFACLNEQGESMEWKKYTDEKEAIKKYESYNYQPKLNLFKPKNAGDQIQIQNYGKRIISKIKKSEKKEVAQSAMSSKPIKPTVGTGILTIPFKIDQLPNDGRIIIGIGEKEKIKLNGDNFKSNADQLNENCYGFHCGSKAYAHNKVVEYSLEVQTEKTEDGSSEKPKSKQQKSGEKKGENSAVQVEPLKKCELKLDFVKDELSYVINGKDKGVAFTKVGLKHTKFHLLVQIWGNGVDLTLLNEEIKFEEQNIKKRARILCHNEKVVSKDGDQQLVEEMELYAKEHHKKRNGRKRNRKPVAEVDAQSGRSSASNTSYAYLKEGRERSKEKLESTEASAAPEGN